MYGTFRCKCILGKCNCRCEGIIYTLTLNFQSLFLQIQLVTLIIPTSSFFFLLNHEEVGSCYPLSFSPFCSIHSHKPSLCLFPSLSVLCVYWKKTIFLYLKRRGTMVMENYFYTRLKMTLFKLLPSFPVFILIEIFCRVRSIWTQDRQVHVKLSNPLSPTAAFCSYPVFQKQVEGSFKKDDNPLSLYAEWQIGVKLPGCEFSERTS